MTQQHMDRCFKSYLADTAKALGGALSKWWPAKGDNTFTEANLWLYFARTIWRDHWVPFSEVQLLKGGGGIGGRARHVDGVALNKTKRLLLTVEAKIIYGAENAGNLANDCKRTWKAPLPKIDGDWRRVCGLLAACWDKGEGTQRIQQWWCDLNSDGSSGQFSDKDWSKLGEHLSRAFCRHSVRVPLPKRLDFSRQLYLLGAFIKGD